jgi:ABC-type lipoprotein export system ATPase subunit
MELFRQLNEQGTTIIQVTHSEVNAGYGNRVIEVRDGWMTMDSANPGLVAGSNVAPEVGAS